MDWQAPPRPSKLAKAPKKKAHKEKENRSSSSEDSTSDSEPGEIKRKLPTREAKEASDNAPSTSATLLKKLANNSFALLSSTEDEDDDDDNTDEEQQTAAKETASTNTKLVNPTPKTIKPPPIFIPDVTNITALVRMITTLVGTKNDFSYKTERGNNVRVMMPDKESYTALRQQLVAQNKRHRTFQPKDERAYRVVIKGLHHTTDQTEIKEELQRHGHTVRDLHNPIGRKSKEPLGIFFANLEPASNNTEIYKVKRICRSVVTVEPPLKFNDVPQCFRCQGFGHTQRYCFLEHRCVKCGSLHDSRACEKKDYEKACCLHCQADHPASFRGCPVYKKAKAQQTPKNRYVASSNKPSYELPNITNGMSYRDALKGTQASQTQNPHPTPQTPPEAPQPSIVEEMFTRIEGMMERMMEKMFAQMTQLVASILNNKSCSK